MGINFRMNDTETAYEKCDLSHIACGGNTDKVFKTAVRRCFYRVAVPINF